MIGKETRKNLLLVENDASMQKMFEVILSGCNWEVVAAENGDAAIREWKRRKFSVILLELNLPHLDGFEIARHIRRMERETWAERTPILAITETMTDEIRGKGLDLGLTGFIPRTIEPGQLCATVARQVGLPADTA